MRMIDLHAFRPRLIEALQDYDRERFFKDLAAGITVGVVALPLAMAFGIASGVKPEQGLITAIVAGFLISALGGSHVQIGGPAGAFIVIVYGIVERYGLTNLLIATALAGILMFAIGALKLGAMVRYVPVAIVIGFTNGIAVLIGLSQLRDLFGLPIAKMPGDFFAQIQVLVTHARSFNIHAFALGAITFVGMFVWPKLFSGRLLPEHLLEGRTLRTAARIPGPVVTLITMSALAYYLKLPVETIGTRFGGIPASLPSLALPPFSWDSAKQLLIPTITIAMLGAIESLMCARIADNMATHLERHDPNQELMAQGVANFVSPFFGGIPATGTIARTVTNLRAGATSPVAGIVHALALLAIVLVAAPLAAHVPLAVLAGILLFVAWNMGEWHEFARLRQFSNQYRTILVGTFVLTVVFDLTVAVEVGLILACAFFIYRMGTLFRVQPLATGEDGQTPPPGVQVFELFGSLFFGAVGKIEALPAQVAGDARCVVLEMHRLISMDTSGLDALQQLYRALQTRNVALVLANVNEQPLSLMRRSGFEQVIGPENIVPTVTAALQAQDAA
ncbi:MAG: SulP family inorganic anion transporter [Burkholderiaceae bacterium]